MKPELQQNLAASASREKRDIWDQFRSDHELIERLRITPHELDSLGKCALLGTLSCKQDLLFILRQIREASGLGTPPTVFASAPTSHEQAIDERAPDLSRIRVRLAPSGETLSQPGTAGGNVQRRVSEQFGVAFWSVILAAGLVWNLAIAASRWRVSLRSKMFGAPDVFEAAQSQAWYTKLDDSHMLIAAEILFLLCALAVIVIRARTKRPRRLKVKPI